MKKSYFLYGLFGLSLISCSLKMMKPSDDASLIDVDMVSLEPSDLEGYADLNQDDIAEHMILKQNKDYCGSGGCTAFLYDEKQHQIARITVVHPPILVAQSTSHGWRDLIVWSHGAYRLMKHDGKSYPLNPSIAPKWDRDVAIKKIEKSCFNNTRISI